AQQQAAALVQLAGLGGRGVHAGHDVAVGVGEPGGGRELAARAQAQGHVLAQAPLVAQGGIGEAVSGRPARLLNGVGVVVLGGAVAGGGAGCHAGGGAAHGQAAAAQPKAA
nr:hypothetical protein [Tanacetum cinerariifolium]